MSDRRIIAVTKAMNESDANSLLQEGWELYAVAPQTSGSAEQLVGYIAYVLVRREKREPGEHWGL